MALHLDCVVQTEPDEYQVLSCFCTSVVITTDLKGPGPCYVNWFAVKVGPFFAPLSLASTLTSDVKKSRRRKGVGRDRGVVVFAATGFYEKTLNTSHGNPSAIWQLPPRWLSSLCFGYHKQVDPKTTWRNYGIASGLCLDVSLVLWARKEEAPPACDKLRPSCWRRHISRRCKTRHQRLPEELHVRSLGAESAAIPDPSRMLKEFLQSWLAIFVVHRVPLLGLLCWLGVLYMRTCICFVKII